MQRGIVSVKGPRSQQCWVFFMALGLQFRVKLPQSFYFIFIYPTFGLPASSRLTAALRELGVRISQRSREDHQADLGQRLIQCDGSSP